jgi:hypothetical protein
MGRFLGLVASSFVHNLLRDDSEPLFFERTVVSDEALSEFGRDQFLRLVAEKGQELLVDLDTSLTHLAAEEKSASGKRCGLGMWFFEDTGAAPVEKHILGEKSHTKNGAGRVMPLEEIDVLAAVNVKKVKE